MRHRRICSLHLPLAALLAAAATAHAGPPSGRFPQPSDPPSAPSAIPAQAAEVPFVPTPDRVVSEMLGLAAVTSNDVVYDLGSGDGRIVVAAARDFGAQAVGVDINPVRVEEGRENARQAGVEGRVEFVQSDLFDVDLRPASVVSLYLLPGVNLRLRPKLLAELRPGSRVVSHDFDMGEWEADAVRELGTSVVYLWVVPAQLGGTWNIEVPTRGGTATGKLTIEQSFQRIEGTLELGARTITLGEPALRGERVSFTAQLSKESAPLRFSGRIRGNKLTGTAWRAAAEDAAKPFAAFRKTKRASAKQR